MKAKKLIADLKIRVVAYTLLVLMCFILPLWWIIGDWYKNSLLNEQRDRIRSQLELYGSMLTVAINKRFALLNGLYAYAQAQTARSEWSEDFNTFAAGLYATSSGIRNFALAPGGVQKYVYPLKGNEKVPGHDLINDKRPNVRKDIQQTIDEIRLLILDVVMPGMNGKEAYEKIKGLKPDIKAIFTSGYTADIIQGKKVIEEDVVFVSKPILPDRFLMKVKEVIESA